MGGTELKIVDLLEDRNGIGEFALIADTAAHASPVGALHRPDDDVWVADRVWPVQRESARKLRFQFVLMDDQQVAGRIEPAGCVRSGHQIQLP